MTMKNHFELFGLPARFALDEAALDAAYRALQNQVHPDKFASAGDAEKRVALQWATRANEAYQTLRCPLKRAAYLCQLGGVDLQTESNTTMPSAFLMQQMEWREELEDARATADVAMLERIQKQLNKVHKDELDQIQILLDQTGDIAGAAAHIRQLMFLEKFRAEINDTFEYLEA